MSEWPQDPNVEGLKLTLERTRGRLDEALRALHLLASHIEWEDDTKPHLDTEGLLVTWAVVEGLMAGYEGDAVREISPGRTPRMNGQSGPTAAAQCDGLAVAFDRVRQSLRENRGLEVGAPMTDLERNSWTRELAIEAMVAVAQMFDPATGVCFHPDAVARLRRRRALLALVHALELAALHGVSEDALLRELEPKDRTTPCPDCAGMGYCLEKSRYLGELHSRVRCPTCGGAGIERRP